MVPNGWCEGRVGDLLDGLESGVSVNGEDRNFGTNEKAVLKVSAVTYGSFNPAAAKVIDGEELERAKTNPKRGQVIISRSNTEELVGASAYVEQDYPNLFLPDKLWQTIPKAHSDMKWLSYVLASNHARYTLSNLATGTSGSMKNITKGELLSLKILIPPASEQNKIAQILSTWDKAITTAEQLLANSQQQKKALIQQLLTGRKRLLDKSGVRFSGEWKFQTISQISKRIQRKSDGEEHPILTISSLSGFVRQDERYSRYMAGESVKNYILLQKGEFAYNKGNSKTFEFGCIFDLENFETGLVPHVYVCFKLNSGLSHRYFKYLFEADYLKPQLGALVNTGVRNNGLLNIKPTEFMATHVPVPSFDEQERIADVLHASSQTIHNLEQKLEALKQEKKALMQQLLTGKRRVKINEKEVA